MKGLISAWMKRTARWWRAAARLDGLQINMELQQIDKSSFTHDIPTKAIRVPATQSQSLLKSLSAYALCRFLFTRKGFPKIVHVPDHSDVRLILLSPDLQSVPPEVTALGLPVEDYTVKVTYEDLSYGSSHSDEVMRRLIPAEIQVPSGFETVGHLAHFNLQDPQLPFKHLIGQVVIDVISMQKTQVRTVVNKVDAIHNTFRTFDMELIAGEPDFVVTQKEGNCNFTFDFRKVYWSSKLSNERQRLLKLLRPQEVLCDMFAGVGPLSIQAAKKGLTVIANDLNPDCYKGMVENAKKNKVAGKMRVYNMDARDFFRGVVGTPREEVKVDDYLSSPPFSTLPEHIDHIYMNLPMDALDFVDVFIGAFDPVTHPRLPTIHVYAFSAEADPRAEFEARITKIWGEWDTALMVVLPVRDVAPRKMMFCVQMQLDPQVAYSRKRKDPRPQDEVQKHPKVV